jgi:Na+/pantothenate symporter
MVVPITGFAIVGKRLAQLSRRTGAVTVPDLFRERFKSPAVGVVALVFILTFMSSMMVAQFKAGALIMKVAWPESGVLALSEESAQIELQPEVFNRLRSAGVPNSVLEAAKELEGQSFSDAEALKASLASTLSPEDFKSYHPRFTEAAAPYDWLFLIGLTVFSLTVVGYTLMGGFLAAVWTDLFQSVMMALGVVLLLVLAIPAAGGLEVATRAAVEQTGPAFASGPGFSPDGREFLPLGLAFSFFFVWTFAGFGTPSSIVRVMASKSTEQIRKSVVLLGGYNLLIYIPLVMICICGRAIIPGLPPGKTDEIIPRLTLVLTGHLPGGSLLAGLVLAAPFGAVMATVSSYLVVIASGIVRDIYQRWVRPDATAKQIRRLTYAVMISVGSIAFILNLKPVDGCFLASRQCAGDDCRHARWRRHLDRALRRGAFRA